ncbi:unnamed protein product [Ostreobium quekettii]|uniref:Uncharacterized protein n=1 Tax=Ostreobium quekettii TaxID=121088 RepID=A0A8S1IZN5_9CHLO|nr:unnamed protein product [Ostreobium quekettii]
MSFATHFFDRTLLWGLRIVVTADMATLLSSDGLKSQFSPQRLMRLGLLDSISSLEILASFSWHNYIVLIAPQYKAKHCVMLRKGKTYNGSHRARVSKASAA